jgi:hypothetical protein
VTPGSWQTWDVLNTTGAGVWATGFVGPGSIGSPLTWTGFVASYPNATILYGFGVNVGSGWGSFTGHVDNVTIGIAGNSTTYDFEPSVACTATCYVDAVNGSDANGGTSIADAKKTIQAGIDAVDPAGTVRVLPGSYDETATNRWVLGANGPHQFGLFIGEDKSGITILGVDGFDTPVAAYGDVLAFVTTNATNNFGPSSVFVEGDDVTIQGLEFGANSAGENKTLEVIGDNFSLLHSVVAVPGGGSVYLNDWRFDESGDTSHLQSYHIEGNWFSQSASLDIASGAGYSGPVSGRTILNNTFDLSGQWWNGISFSGSDTGVPWFVYSVGGAVIQGNSFSGGTEQYIRARGTYDNSQFDWESYWNDNTFDKGTILINPPFDVQTYSYTSGSFLFNNVRRIGSTIQLEEDHAADGNTLLVKPGTYQEQVVINTSISLESTDGALVTTILAPTTIPPASNPDSTIVKITGAGESVEMSGFTVSGPGPTGCGSIGTGIFVRDGAYANIHDNRVLDVRDNPFSGCQNGNAILVGRLALGTSGTADIVNNLIQGYQKNGITVSNAGSWANITGNTIQGKGPTAVIAQNGIQISGGATGQVDDNEILDHSYTPSNVTSTGMLLYGSNADTSGNNLSENQTGIYHIEGSGVHDGNVIAASAAGTGSLLYYGYVVDAPPPGLSPSPFEDDGPGGGEGPSAPGGPENPLSTQTVTISNNELDGDGMPWSIGIGAYAGYGALDIDLTVSNTFVRGFDYGLDIFQASYTTSTFVNVLVEDNSITGNVSYGLANTDAIQVNAESNWWGHESGPAPAGSGDEVYGDVDYDPWLCEGTDTDAAVGFQPTGALSGSCQGPIVRDVTGHYDPVADGATVNLAAVVDDSATGGSTIQSAEYTLNGGLTWVPMTATDGSFDEVVEDVKATIIAPATPDVYNLCLRGTDATNSVGPETCVLLVVYDPDAGFVTGGGWINSPAGAYRADPQLTGKANFGFVSKYKKGGYVPEGSTEFNLSVGDFNFHATAYDWLIVNRGDYTAHYQGHGTVNDELAPNNQEYRFELWGLDGPTDLFRIRIWWDNGVVEEVVYDNYIDHVYGEPLGGGSITVHTKK